MLFGESKVEDPARDGGDVGDVGEALPPPPCPDELLEHGDDSFEDFLVCRSGDVAEIRSLDGVLGVNGEFPRDVVRPPCWFAETEWRWWLARFLCREVVWMSISSLNSAPNCYIVDLAHREISTWESVLELLSSA